MSAEHVVGIVGIVVVAACLVVIEEMLRRDIKKHGKRALPAEPRCASCGHDDAYHWKGGCRYERGDARDGNDSYGTAWKGYTTPRLCGCTRTPSQLWSDQ
ncbi:hypothetical protein ACIPH4_07925 [Streptomyces tendae]|uniref:hypothetical protein n=1 Tax=Streptomyces tendae TaxID=1932 RepID=UPI00367AAAA2